MYCDDMMNPGKKGIICASSIILVLLSSIPFVPVVVSHDSYVAYNTDKESNVTIDVPVYRAVLVAIGYSNNLPYSVKQLYGFRSTLLLGGNWKTSNIVNLTEDRATKGRIYSAIQWLADTADENDVSLFYFIGHGDGNDTSQCIIPYDDPIYDVELDQYLSNISGSLIVIIDACRSGGFIEELSKENRLIVTACGKDEDTYQVKDLESGMFGFFLNLSLSWATKKVEMSFYWANILSLYYGNKLSKQYGENYIIHPQLSDGTSGMTRVILKHSYLLNIYRMLNVLTDEDTSNSIWRM